MNLPWPRIGDYVSSRHRRVQRRRAWAAGPMHHPHHGENVDCIKCHGTGGCWDEVLGIQETWMCERCNGSGEEPYLDWQQEQDNKLHALIYRNDPFVGLITRQLAEWTPFTSWEKDWRPRTVPMSEMLDAMGLDRVRPPRYFEEA